MSQSFTQRGTSSQVVRSCIRLAIALLVLSVPLQADASLITNGSFEEPNIDPGTFGLFGSIPGWSPWGVAVPLEIQDHVAGSPFDGDQFLETDSNAGGAIIQGFSTVAGGVYNISLAYSPRPGVSAADNAIYVYFCPNGSCALLEILSGDGGGLSDTAWATHSYAVTALGSFSWIGFVDGGYYNPAFSNSLGGYLDAVDVTAAVPEPGTVATLGLGLAGLVLAARRRASRRS